MSENVEMSYRGAGAPIINPSKTNNTFNKLRREFILTEPTQNDKEHKVSLFKLNPGAGTTVTILDSKIDYAVYLHARFQANGKFTNNVVCTMKTTGNCRVCTVLKEKGRWFLAGTVIDHSEWAIPDGKRKGEVIRDQRRLLLVSFQQKDSFKDIQQEMGDLSGKTFKVSRSSDNKSARIGTSWFPKGALTTEQLKDKLGKVATDYGLSVDDYIKPYDYDKLFATPSEAYIDQVVEAIRSSGKDAAPVQEEQTEIDF